MGARAGARIAVTALLAGAAVITNVAASPAQAATYHALDPATWSNAQLAAQVTFVCLDAAATSTQRTLAAEGIGGIGLLGDDAPNDIGSRLASVRAAAPHGIPPMIGSDEEGGLVQRLKKVIYPLPSAEVMGTWSTTRIQSTAYQYAKHMRALGVPMDFAPVADLGIPGYYIDSLHRAFSEWPKHVAADVTAWIKGMREAGVLTTVKHWPGHGQASNSHTGAAIDPPLSTLESRDMIPFNTAFSVGVPAVMVGHLRVPHLTETGVPASESPSAIAYLRRKAGYSRLIITDSLAMAAATSAVGLTTPQAAVKALRAGVDIALTCAPSGVVSAITHALDSGTLSRAKIIESVRRLLTLKARVGLLHAYTGPWHTTASVHVAASTVKQGAADTLSTTVSGGYRRVFVQQYTSSAWHSIRTVVTGPHGWARVGLPTGTAGTHKFRVWAPAEFPRAGATSSAVTVKVTTS